MAGREHLRECVVMNDLIVFKVSGVSDNQLGHCITREDHVGMGTAAINVIAVGGHVRPVQILLAKRRGCATDCLLYTSRCV